MKLSALRMRRDVLVGLEEAAQLDTLPIGAGPEESISAGVAERFAVVFTESERRLASTSEISASWSADWHLDHADSNLSASTMRLADLYRFECGDGGLYAFSVDKTGCNLRRSACRTGWLLRAHLKPSDLIEECYPGC
jgi:hypothetical protein